MSQLHSTWLMPSASDEAALQSVVDLLSRQFGTPRFQAHLTLVEGVERSVDELAKAIRQAVEGIDRFQVAIKEIGTSDLYFRSFYARFEASGPLAELHRNANALVLPEEHPAFMPHISLLYGADDTAEKEAARQHWMKQIVGQPICFDRVCIASAG
ncbi:MAG TPA: 2'-5' RNA ligase family protein, partial [Pararhizobium sp.]|nr:2'-5' RNA ligase family protein [Pararhizobium sp.]